MALSNLPEPWLSWARWSSFHTPGSKPMGDLQPRNNAVMTGNITTLRYLVDEVGVKTLNSDCKGYSPLQMAVVWGQHLG